LKQELLSEPDFYKHNDYIKILQVKNQMNINQQKIFDAVLSTVQHMKKNGQIENIIREGDLVLDYDIFKTHIMKGSRISKINRKVLKEAMENMVSIRFSWSTDDEVGAVVLFQKGVIDFNKRKVKVTFGKDFRTENLVPSSHYTALSYDYLNKFKSQYSRSLYQYFKMLIGKDMKDPFKTDIVFEIDNLKSLLGVNPNSHKEYYNNNSSFIKRCITPAIKEINLYSDIDSEYIVNKYARKIVSIDFVFSPKRNILSTDEINSISKKQTSKEKSNSKIKSFKEFKENIITLYKGKDICNRLDGYKMDSILRITPSQLLQVDDKILSKAESLKVWEYLYNNQEKIGDLRELTDLDFAKRFIGKNIKTLRVEDGEEKQMFSIIVNIIEDRKNLFCLHLQDASDKNIPVIKSKELYTLKQIEDMEFVE
jgi:plasmid replication initiation protein